MANIIKHIKEVSGISPHDIPREIIDAQEPVVFRGLVKEWDAVKVSQSGNDAAVDYIKRYYNGQNSLINKGHEGIQGRYFYNEDFSGLNYDTVRMRVDDALDLILASEADPSQPSYYISSNTIDTHLPGFREKNALTLPRASVPFPTYKEDVKIWIGTRSTATCHYDALDNIACVVAGRRRFSLFPPEQFKNLYFGPLDPTPGGQPISLVDFNNPDYEKFPRFKEAEAAGLMAELEPGDAIYIPSMWMHHIEGLNAFNILVNYWWTDAPLHTGSAMNVLYHAMLSLREKPEHEKKAWKHLFDYYIFGDQKMVTDHIPEMARGFLDPLDELQSRRLRTMLLQKLNR